MDLRSFYQKIREVASALDGDYIVVVSLATPDGGKAGVATEVSRYAAAKLIIEGRARAASSEEASIFREEIVRQHSLRIQQEQDDYATPIAVLPEEVIARILSKSRRPIEER